MLDVLLVFLKSRRAARFVRLSAPSRVSQTKLK